jgi:DNA-binding response OmpR family regulator
MSASPFGEDHDSLKTILKPMRVLITAACNRREALLTIANQRFGLILCEAQLNWKDILSYLADAVEPPRLVITSRMNERLWAEALNLGTWDLLVKPFDGAEVRRVVASALVRRPAMLGAAAAG